MKNLNNIANYIKFEEYFKIAPNLKQLENASFTKYLLCNNNQILNLIHIGSLNDINFFTPLYLEDINNYVLFNKNIKSLTSSSFNFLSLDNKVFIFKLTICFVKFSYTNIYFKNTNKYIDLKSDNINFLESLYEINKLNFNDIYNEFTSIKNICQ